MIRALVVCATICVVSLGACLNRPVGEASPIVSNVVVEQIGSGIDEVDLLFMIDNSVSMADKQSFFARAVPALVGRLVTPRCMAGAEVAAPLADGSCPAGHVPEFDRVRDIHLAIVSSSLGGYTGDECLDASKNDGAHLVGSLERVAGAGTRELGFLAWDPDQRRGGIADVDTLIASFRAQVTGTGESGCGFEASLEAWYRFLIEPFPPLALRRLSSDPGDTRTDFVRDDRGRVVVDPVLLEQRRAFLRPDSLVSVIVLSDENDCSVRVPGPAAALTGHGRLMRASQSCAADPNDRCCRNCGAEPAPGCPDNAADAECSKGAWSLREDPENLRCFQQKQRFGHDFLFPTARYAVGLTKPRLCPESPHGDADCDCDMARAAGIDECAPGPSQPNPLFTDLSTGLPAARSADLVFYTAIVGVPWQDLATPETRDDPRRLRFMTAGELEREGRWDVILGDPARGVPPLDPFMRESVVPRAAEAHPLVPGEAIAPTDAPFMANQINGHEYVTEVGLQYACIFPLPGELQRDCLVVGDSGCDCPARAGAPAFDNPLCQDAAGYGSVQRFAKAFPGIRQLDVARRFGENAIVASVCPKIIDELEPDFGYGPAVDAIVERLAVELRDPCLPRPIERNEDGTLPCRVVEVSLDGACDVPPPGRSLTRDAEPRLDRAVRDQLRRAGRCADASCSAACVTTLSELEGEARAACESGAAPDAVGYCYVDPEPPPRGSGVGEPGLVAHCSDTARRVLRLVGDETPRRGAGVFIACAGKSFE